MTRYRKCEHNRRPTECGLCNGVAVYKRHLWGLARRGMINELTETRYRWLIQLPCVYCGEPAGGVDRVKSEYGYTTLNSVSSCWRCNAMKSARSAPEFIAGAAAIVAYSSTYEQFKTRWIDIRTGGPDLWQSSTSNATAAFTGSSATPSSGTTSAVPGAAPEWLSNCPDRAGSGRASTAKEGDCEADDLAHAPEPEANTENS